MRSNSHQARAMASALQAAHREDAAAQVCALQQVTRGKDDLALGAVRKAILKESVPSNQVKGTLTNPAAPNALLSMQEGFHWAKDCKSKFSLQAEPH